MKNQYQGNNKSKVWIWLEGVCTSQCQDEMGFNLRSFGHIANNACKGKVISVSAATLSEAELKYSTAINEWRKDDSGPYGINV